MRLLLPIPMGDVKDKLTFLVDAPGCIKLPDREPSRLAAGGNGPGRWTFCRLLALVAASTAEP